MHGKSPVLLSWKVHGIKPRLPFTGMQRKHVWQVDYRIIVLQWLAIKLDLNYRKPGPPQWRS